MSSKQKKAKPPQIRIPSNVAKLIPYSSVTKNGDMIETKPGSFSRTYLINGEIKITEDNLEEKLSVIKSFLKLTNIPFQFSSIGTRQYITFSVQATTVEEAEKKMEDHRATFDKIFSGSETTLSPLTLTEQLELFHSFYNHYKDGSVTDKIDGKDVAPKNMNKLTTKDLVGPDKLNFGKDYIETDHGYIRIMFVNTFANHLPPDFFQLFESQDDIISTIHFRSCDPKPILETIEKEIKEYKLLAMQKKKAAKQTNTKEKKDKNEQKKQEKDMYPNNEEIHIKESYTALFRDAVEKEEKIYQLSFLMTLFAPTLDELNEKTRSFQTEKSHFFCKVTTLDYQQKRAMSSVLPLANDELSISRTFSLDSASIFFPFISGSGLPKEKLNALTSEMKYYTIKAKMEKAKTRNELKVKKTVQETIPYKAAHLEDGIIETVPGVFSRMYRFEDINYSTATEEDQTMFLIKYSQLLNRFDSSVRCQIVLNNKNVNMDEFKEDNLLEMKNNELDVYRKEYNALILSKMEEGRNGLKKERYFVISVEDENFEAAKRTFARLDPEIINAFKEIGGSVAEPMTTTERLEVLYDIYNIGNEGAFLAELKEGNETIKSTDLEALYRMGVNSKDLIAPSGFYFHRDWFQMGDKFCRVLYLTDLPNTLSDRFVSELSSTSCNLVISINLETVRQDKAVKLVKHQMLNINTSMQQAQQQAMKNGYSPDLVPHDLKQAQEEANDLLRNLTGRNQKMFVMTFTVLLFADDMDELNANTEIVTATGRKFLCGLKKLNYQQEDGLTASMPYCFSRLSTTRTLTTDSTIIFSPFDTQELVQKKGMYYGQNATSHNLIIFSRDSSQNGNGWILGTPGCVDRETEFFDGKGWKSIADYKEGDLVLQFDTKTNEATLVKPEAYIKEPCEMMYHFETKNGLNQTLSPEHRVLYYKRHTYNSEIKQDVKEMSAEDLYLKQNAGKFDGKFKTDFEYSGDGMDLSDLEIKIILAVIYDKRFENDGVGSNHFTSDWYKCNKRQLQLICDNILQLCVVDKKGQKTFSTTVKENADFIQFAFSACGYRASITEDDKTHNVKSTEYHISISENTMVGLEWHNDGRISNTVIKEVKPADGYKYCFTVPTHALVLRRNGRIFITGNSGKSFACKREISNVFLNTEDDILIIDPEREYSPLAKAFGGSIVRIAPGSKYHLNPLDMDRDYADDDDPVVLKSDFVLSLCESVIGGRYGLTPSQIAIIDRCVVNLYQEFAERYNYDKRYTPTLLDFENMLKAQSEREARELALAFEIYTEGSLDVFAHESNVDINNRFVVYDIKDIGSNIKTMAYLIVLDNIWNRVVANRKKGKKTWIYMDEVYILFEKEESSNYLRQIFSRGRKWSARTTAITQNVEPILQNTIATTMLSNSAFIMLLNQAPVDRDILASLLKMDMLHV